MTPRMPFAEAVLGKHQQLLEDPSPALSWTDQVVDRVALRRGYSGMAADVRYRRRRSRGTRWSYGPTTHPAKSSGDLVGLSRRCPPQGARDPVFVSRPRSAGPSVRRYRSDHSAQVTLRHHAVGTLTRVAILPRPRAGCTSGLGGIVTQLRGGTQPIPMGLVEVLVDEAASSWRRRSCWPTRSRPLRWHPPQRRRPPTRAWATWVSC